MGESLGEACGSRGIPGELIFRFLSHGCYLQVTPLLYFPVLYTACPLPKSGQTHSVLVTPSWPPGLCIHHHHLPCTNRAALSKIRQPHPSSPPHTNGCCAFSWGEPSTNTPGGRKRNQAPSTFLRNRNFKRSSCLRGELRAPL